MQRRHDEKPVIEENNFAKVGENKVNAGRVRTIEDRTDPSSITKQQTPTVQTIDTTKKAENKRNREKREEIQLLLAFDPGFAI
ncbi:MAG: hypothetical protein COA62_10325 [Rhodobiaceae bacterium]|nr:MAG: hypothetical protein COA62_10325 [Rhodobiaceae bacterium]